MKLLPPEELARLVPFVSAWDEVRQLCHDISGSSPQLVPFHWQGDAQWEHLREELCPLLYGRESWKSVSQSHHYRQFIDALCDETDVTAISCFCGLSHLMFPLHQDGIIAGAIVCSAVRTQADTFEQARSLAEKIGVAPEEVERALSLLPQFSVEELIARGQAITPSVAALRRCFSLSGTETTVIEQKQPGPRRGEDETTPESRALGPFAEGCSTPTDAPRSQGVKTQQAPDAPHAKTRARLAPDARAEVIIPVHAKWVTRRTLKRRAVVTGLGIVSPIGIGKDAFREAVRQGRNGVGRITLFDPKDMISQVSAEVKGFRPEDYIDPKTTKRTGRATQFAVAAAKQAVADAALNGDYVDPSRFGVIIGSAAGGLEFGQEQVERYLEGGSKAISPFLSIVIFAGACSSEVSMELGAKGPSITVSTGCAASNDAFGYALQLVRDDKADIVLVGGTEAPIFPVIHGSFCSLRALSTRNDDPEHASRPFDRERDGFVIAEGAAIVVMEELEHAQARNARIYGEILGYAATGDAFHMTRPSPDGADATRAIHLAIQDAGVSPSEIQYISAHGSSTPLNDRTETAAIKAVFGKRAYHIPVSSTKSMTGHSIGASGAFDLVAVFLAMHDEFLPPTINLEVPDPECDLDYVPNRSREHSYDLALSNTFGFGGKNACIVVSKW